MTMQSSGGFWNLFLIIAIAIGLGGPAVVTGAQRDGATPAAGASPVAADPVEPLSTASVVPADVPLYVAFTLDPTSDQWLQAELLLRRAGLAGIRDQAIAELQAEMAATGEDDLRAFFGGEVAIAVTSFADFAQMGAAVPPPDFPLATPATVDGAPALTGFVAVIRAADPDAAEDLARELAAENAAGQGVTVSESEYQGVTIHAVVPQDQLSNGLAYARLGDALIVSTTVADLEPLIDVSAGGEPALASAEHFTRVRGELPNDFLAYGFVNGLDYQEELESVFAAAEAELGPTFPMDQAFTGLDAYSGFTIWADDPGFHFDTITIPADGATLPPLPDNFESTLDDRVPGDSLLFVNGYDLGLTLGPSFDALGAFVAMAAAEDPTFPFPLPAEVTEGEEPSAIYELLGRFLAFNPRTALIDQLVDEWAYALSVSSPDPAGISGVFVSGAEDEAVLNDTVTKLAVWVNLLVVGGLASTADPEGALFGDQPLGAHTEEVDGALTQVIEIPVPDMHASVRLQWGIIDGELVFGIGDGFADYVAGAADSLAGSPRYQSAMGELPAEHNAVFYLDIAQTIALIQPLLEQQFAAQDAASPGMVGTPEAGPAFPDLSAIQALASVGFLRDGLQGSSAILLIAEQ